MARKLQVEIIGDASSLQRAFGKASKSGSTLGSSLKSLGKTAVVAAGAAGVGALFVTMKRGFDEMAESQRVVAQTQAVIKSTGGVANVAAKDVDSLATSLSKMSGVDDEVIAGGENMLLTFTNVRNEVGKGNDIFNQATGTLLDMSTALGTDMKQSAIQLGKALNDPIKGTAALRRVGVSFTADQQKQIKALVDSGKTMQAQKVILAELNKEFGGSAKAAGETLPGQLNKLKNAFDEAAGALVTTLIPYLSRFFAFVNQNMPTIQAIITTAVGAIAKTFELVAEAVDKVKGPLLSLVDTGKGIFEFFKSSSSQATVLTAALGGFAATVLVAVTAIKAITVATNTWAAAQVALNLVMAANPFVLIAAAIVGLGAALVIAYTRSETFRNAVNKAFNDVKAVVLPIVDALRNAWERFGDDVVGIARTAFGVLKAVILTPLQNIFSSLKVIIDIFHGDWSKAWDDFKQIPIRQLNSLVTIVKGMAGIFLVAAQAIGAALVSGIVAGLRALPGAVTAALGALRGAINAAAASAAGWAYHIGLEIVQGILNGLGGLLGAVKDKVESGLRGALSSINPFSPIEEGAARLIGEPIVRGAVQGLERLESTFNAKTTELVRNAVTNASDAIKAGQGKFADAWAGYSSAALSVFDNIASQVQTKSEKALANLQAAHEKAQIIGAVQEARAGLAEAQAGGDPEAIVSAQKQLDDALYQQKIYGLQQRAEAERADTDNRVALDRLRFQQWLETRTVQQQQQIALEGQGMQGIVNKIKSFNPAFRQRGIDIGESLAAGLLDMRGKVEDAANALAAAVARAMSVSIDIGRTAVGNAEARRDQGLSRIGGMATGGIVTSPTLTWIGERGPEAVIPLSQYGGGGGDTLVFNFPNYVGTRTELIDEVRRGLFEVNRRNPGALPGVA